MISTLRANPAMRQQPPQRPTQSPQDAFKAMDSQSKGYVTEAEFEKSAPPPRISSEGARLSAQTQPSADEAFAQLDTNRDGQLTSAEFEAGAPTGATPGQSGPRAAAGPGGGPPPGPAGAGGGPPRSSTRYEPADTNKDGTVSAAEQQAFDRKNVSSATTQEQLQLYRSVDHMGSQEG